MDCSSLLSVSGNSEASQMRQLSEQFETIPRCEAERSTVTTEASITACKKVLCSNSLLESVEYWLRNEKKLCQVGFLEDEARTNYPTICFVNLDGVNANFKSKELQKKLDTVSPDLPYLIKSLNICQMKDHEFMLVSGLIAPGSCQDKADDSQKDESIKYLEDECLPPPVQWPRPPDVCLLQSARKCRKNDMACVVYEINKCMIGLDYFKGKKKHLVNTANWKTEEETNYSGSSIEEDFLTASEQFNDERDEASNDLKDPPRNNGFDPARGTKQSKAKSRVLLQMRQNKDNLFCHKTCNLQDTLVHKCADEESSGIVPLRCCEGNYVLEERGGERHKSERNAQEERLVLKSPHNNHLANSSLEEYHNACTIESVNMHLQTNIPVAPVDIQDTENKTSASPSLKENHCMDGDYASNLAESVLQDAFIRLSQSEPTFTTEAAVSICTESIDALSPSNTKVSLSNPPHPWNILPKIVIVQSPDNCENVSEWQEHCSPTLASRPLNETPGYVQEHIIDQNNSTSTGLPLSSVEVALVCAANVVGTISSPYITESLQMDGALYDITENFPHNGEKGDEALLCGSECGEMNFSFSSALHGVTQVASAIGVAGLSDEPDMSFPAASSGLLSAAETSAAVTLQCSVSVGSCVDTFAHNIAEVLFKEAATILTKPDKYRSVGGFMKSVDQKIIETVTRPKVSHWEELSKDDFALNMSNLILKHSFEEANRVEKKHQEKENNSGVNTTKIFIESANKSLFSILYFTCRKIKDIVGHNDVAILFQDDGIINKDLKPTSNQDGISMNCNTTDSVEKFGHIPSDQGNQTDPSIFDEKSAGPELSQQVNLTSKCLHSRRGSDCANIAHNLTNQLRSRNSGAAITNVAIPQDQQKICEKDTNSSFSIDACEMDSRYGGAAQVHTCNYTSALTDIRAQSQPDKDQNILMISRHITLSPSKSSFHAEKLTDTNLSINGFADQISKTVVSMATEMAAICLENTNAKQPWFCPWNTRLGDHEKFMVPQTSSSRAHARSKESQISTAKRLKPPRLSEIKRKTQEQPELKEKLMNRVVDESLNFDDALDQINNFAHEVTAKIVNSAELTMIDSVRQGQGLARNRLQGDRWSRGKTSSYESIPEEDADSNNSWAALGAMTKFGQPTSRASSISKQSSCESITDEFSNFMMNQMENEGWGFELLLDYYASKHASNILNAALQQVCRKNGHLGVNATCLSKQSSTESITEEFYRYMLHELDKESKEMKANKDFHNMLIPPAGRTTMCFRQSSMPDRRASEGRLTVTPPVKANSLDGFAQNGRRNTLNVHLGDTALSTNLYKSLTDSCLYQKNKTDHITDMLISETWSNSIEALMRKNKIICDDADNQCSEQLSGSAQQCTEQCPTKVVADTFQCGKSIHSSQQSSIETAPHDSGIKSKICETDVHRAEKAKSVTNKKCFASHEWAAVKKKKMTHYPREVPLIHIEDDQQEEIKQCPQGKAVCSTKRLMEKKLPEVDSEGQTESASLGLSYMKNLVAIEKATAEETPCSLSTSDDSMGSWSQLINEEDHAEDSSSYLHLSESNGNSSTSSSLGLVDLDAYQENPSVRILPSEIISEKETVKDNQECMDENASQLALCTINSHMNFLVLNFDLSPECADAELRAILQWIAASELGFPVIYFKKSQQKQIQKFLDVIHFTDQKAWKLKDLFLAIMQFCELQEGGKLPTSSLFDWLLEFG